MILIIDNYDSFTFNLVQLLGETGNQLSICRNDEVTLEQVRSLNPTHVVISPGPCTPKEAGISTQLFLSLDPQIPMLGVCLGHQALGEAFGGQTIKAKELMHGKTGGIRHTGEGILRGIPSPFTATRYHSLITSASSLPGQLIPVAWSNEQGPGELAEIQAMHHVDRPLWGVQFHPESFFSQHGKQLLQNFLEL
ncbi:MAG: aminodeoxychorismate/anthranilate synthase component II [Longimicrobiales bacterium]|jgi:anthranilate synthase/aminodeoxychorismate synthase-like glutamine amidotransferase|nr:aminodeoxychorismate/anthranilate synthase component II [Longimicrobiales bacterium]|tara:strand:- start:49 stop:630 length:582 start_codon:yes stop_codon:yes gene_type:complete